MRLAAIVMLVMLPATARASAPTPGAFGPLPAELHAGQTVELTWDRAPAGARELEILLYPSPDARTAIRVTAEIDGERSRARWRVPNVPAEGARLALRWGDAGGEFAGAWSAPFRIVADPGRAPERALVVEGPRPLGDDAAPARELADGARLAAHD
ncbi:MAG TPA: hypothetical protein VFK69_06305, partial [Candidatus Eisenbacteria bacterium]|nr:hypothetical protein [Candidatus Eisenbacteria bacterium]